MSNPIGTIIAWSSNGSIPDDYLLCDGSAVSRSEYAELFNVIGTRYGSGDGSTTFNVPDLRRKIGYGLGVTTNFSDGAYGGEHEHQLVLSELPRHQHVILAGSPGVTGIAASGWRGGNIASRYIFNTGGDQSHENTSPYVTMDYIISSSQFISDPGGPYGPIAHQDHPEIPYSVQLDGSGSTSSDTYKWYIGSINESNLLAEGVDPVVNYDQVWAISPGNGVKTLWLQITLDEKVDQTSTTIALSNTLPVADAGGPYGILYEGDSIYLNGHGSMDVDGDIVAWKWYIESIDDPQLIATGEVPLVSYDDLLDKVLLAGGNIGPTKIYLIVQDDDGEWSEPSVTDITLNVRNPVGGVSTFGTSLSRITKLNYDGSYGIFLSGSSFMDGQVKFVKTKNASGIPSAGGSVIFIPSKTNKIRVLDLGYKNVIYNLLFSRYMK